MGRLHHAKALLFHPPHDISIASSPRVCVDAEDRRDAGLILSLALGIPLAVAGARDGRDGRHRRLAAADARLPGLLEHRGGDIGSVLVGDGGPEGVAVG